MNVLRREIQHLSKLCFLFPDLFFGSLQSGVFLLQFLLSPHAVFDIGTRNIPTHDLSLVVAHRIVASQKPTIASIMFAQPQLHVVSRAASQSTIPTSLCPFQVIRVSVSARAPLQPLIKANAEVIEHHAIGIKTFAAGAEYRNKLGREIHDLSDLDFLLPNFIFRLLPVVDIDVASVPTDNLSGVVKQGEDALEEPAVFSVEPPETCFHLEGLTLRHSGSPLDLYFLNFVGMICCCPTPPQCLFQRHSRVIQPALVDKVDPAVGSRAPVESRDSVDNSANSIFRLLGFGDVSYRPNKLEVAQAIPRRVS